MQAQGLILLALLIGGGGLAYGLRNLAIQLVALAILAANPSLIRSFIARAPRPLPILVACSLALPLVQLVPLPPGLWQALPGRGPVEESFAILGVEDAWFPLSLDPMRSFVAFCGTLAPATIVIVASQLDTEERLRLVRTAILACALVFAIGAVQLTSANTLGLLYAERTQPDVLYATFPNRNSTAMLFVVALALLAGTGARLRLPGGRWTLAALAAFFVLGAVLTQSRSGMALLVPVAAFAAWRGADERANGWRIVTLGGIVAVAVLGASLASGGRVSDSVERFSEGAADRPEMWEDSLYAARHYAPFGSGMGTFDEVFQLHESLEYVSPRKAGRAHSDWLEIAIEGGVVALALALGWLAWSGYAALKAPASQDRWMRRGAGVAIGCIALQSLLDYPLRNQSLLCMAALCVAVLAWQREAAR